MDLLRSCVSKARSGFGLIDIIFNFSASFMIIFWAPSALTVEVGRGCDGLPRINTLYLSCFFSHCKQGKSCTAAGIFSDKIRTPFGSAIFARSHGVLAQRLKGTEVRVLGKRGVVTVIDDSTRRKPEGGGVPRVLCGRSFLSCGSGVMERHFFLVLRHVFT